MATMVLKSLVFLPVDHPEIEAAFQALPGGPAAYNERYGEVWEYMGTARIASGRLVGRYQHEFRHRAHPDYDERVYRTFLSVLTDDEAQAFEGME